MAHQIVSGRADIETGPQAGDTVPSVNEENMFPHSLMVQCHLSLTCLYPVKDHSGKCFPFPFIIASPNS